jgi:hypothetical protein
MTSTFWYISFELTFKVRKAKELAQDRCRQYGLGIKDVNIMLCTFPSFPYLCPQYIDIVLNFSRFAS